MGRSTRSHGLRTGRRFSEADLRLFEEVLPTYSTVVEVKDSRRFAANVLSTYVGSKPGELIMNGQFAAETCAPLGPR